MQTGASAATAISVAIFLAASVLGVSGLQCPPCGNQSVPYPLSTSSDCGHPNYKLSCTAAQSQLQLHTISGSYSVLDITSSAQVLVLAPASFLQSSGNASCISQDLGAGGLLLDQSQPFSVTSSNSIIFLNCSQILLQSPLNCSSSSPCHEALMAAHDAPCRSLLCCSIGSASSANQFSIPLNASGCSAYTSVVSLDPSVSAQGWDFGIQLRWQSPSEPPCTNQSQCTRHSVCSAASGNNGNLTCLCESGYIWDPFTGLCNEDAASKRRTALIASLTSTLCVALIASLVFTAAICRRRRVRNRAKAKISEERSRILSVNGAKAALFSGRDMKKATDNFSQERLLGSGDTALRAREESAKEVVEKKTAQEAHTSLDGGSIKTDAKGKDHPSLEVQENLRRKHGSHRNKGKVPWNKGQQHSEETKQRIRERTREAMEDPKLRERLRIKAEGLTLSSETKLKISTAIVNLWNAKRKVRKRQESCVVEWEEMIADAARRGSDGDVVYQWDSYTTILWELRATWKELRRRRATTDQKSADHRSKISEAIKAKWTDPNYRKSVHSGVHSYLSNCSAQSVERRSRRTFKRVNGNQQSGISVLGDDVGSITMAEKKSPVVKLNPAKNALQAYKDPLTENKLEKLKWIRANRLSVKEKKRKELTERARVLMAEAKRAANALELAAANDKHAVAPLLETRRLLAEAARSFETAGLGS